MNPHSAASDRIDRGPSRRALLLGALAAPLAPAGRARAESAGHVWRAWPAGKTAPPLDLAGLDGSRWRLRDHADEVVLLNFWATWCDPCREELPSLMRLAAREAPRGLRVIAIDYRESPLTVQGFVRRAGLTLPVLLDGDGRAAAQWTSRLFPTTILVARGTTPAGTLMGPLDWDGDEARALLAPHLAAPSRNGTPR